MPVDEIVAEILPVVPEKRFRVLRMRRTDKYAATDHAMITKICKAF